MRDEGWSDGSGAPPAVTRQLSPRETEILKLLCSGMTAPQVAAELGLSRGSVKNKRRAIYQKLHVRTLAEARAATAEGLEPQTFRIDSADERQP